jgi:hypothetical protein
MTIASLSRTVIADRLFIAGWFVIAITGQSILSSNMPALEWLAFGWVAAALCLMQRSSCLPLLILTGPLFLCAPQNAWAWATPAWTIILVLRIASEASPRNLLWIILWGTFALAISWPRDSGALLLGVSNFEFKEILRQWMRPAASWAIFPFRQSFDRALAVSLAASLIIVPGYFITARIWKSLLGACLLAIGSSYAAAILPWQAPHRFLGTTNYPFLEGFLFPGAGYNPCYLPFIIAAALPWFLIPLRYRYSWAHLGLLPLLIIPAFFLNQRSLTLAIIIISFASIVLLSLSLASRAGRRRLQTRVLSCHHQRRIIFSLATGALIITALWSLRMGILDQKSLLRVNIQQRIGSKDSVWVKKTPNVKPARPQQIATGTSVVSTPKPTSTVSRLEEFLSHFDSARANMWCMGLRKSWEDGFWRGAGAGTWARFHRAHRTTRLYFDHMHNTYLNLIFEYGVIPMITLYLLVAFLIFRILLGKSNQPRAWLLYFAGMSTVAFGTDLLYFPFSNYCLLVLCIVILAKSVMQRKHIHDMPA